MVVKRLLAFALLAVAACSQQKAPVAVDPAVLAALSSQLEKLDYLATITHEGDQISVHIGQASVRVVRRAICR